MGTRKLSADEVIAIRERYAEGGVSQSELADEYGVSQKIISDCVRGESYQDAGGPTRGYEDRKGGGRRVTEYTDMRPRALLGYFQSPADPPPPDAIYELRRRTGDTRPEFAERLGLPTQTIHREGRADDKRCTTLEGWENGRCNPDAEGRGKLREVARKVLT